MKGLLIKDWKLLTRQKTTLFIVLAIILFFPMLEMDPGFIVSYTMTIMVFMSVGTLSYDDFDNGMAFLFSLPIDRKTYVREKYVLGLAAAVIGWLFATVINVVYLVAIANESAANVKDVLITVVIIFPVAVILWEILLPMQLKFGAEKARVVLFIVAGVMAAVFFIGRRSMNLQQTQKMNTMLESLAPSQVGIALFAVAIAGLLISYVASVKIVEKKEY